MEDQPLEFPVLSFYIHKMGIVCVDISMVPHIIKERHMIAGLLSVETIYQLGEEGRGQSQLKRMR